MQISQTLHMAIELYPNLNYLLILDHYDDIALFDSDVSPETVSYYQMKTNEESISIDTAISKEWTTKLYEHLSDPEWIVNELGLITNCPLKIVVHYKDDAGKKHTEEKNYTAERTALRSLLAYSKPWIISKVVQLASRLLWTRPEQKGPVSRAVKIF